MSPRAPENEAGELHYCPICLKGYKRREHLQRHRTTHNADRPYCCTNCDAAFKRTDILRRHMETCDGRPKQQGTTTRKRRACDRCVRQKKACNAYSPCQNCQKRGVSCHYSHLGYAPGGPSTTTADVPTATDDAVSSVDSMSWLPEDVPDIAPPSTSAMTSGFVVDPSSQLVPFQFGDNWGGLVHEAVTDLSFLDSTVVNMISQEWPMFMTDTYGTSQPVIPKDVEEPYHGYTFHFLADFTSRTGLVESFDCGTLAQRRDVVSHYYQSALNSANMPGLAAPSPEAGQFMSEFQGPGDDPEPYEPDVPNLSLGWQTWLDNPMVVKLQQIVLRIKEVVMIKPRNSTVTLSWSPALGARCLDFFSFSRFGKFLELYWSIWHPNVNFLHRPTFDPTNTPSTLLAAMATIGACVSPDSKDNEDARLWFNCIEEMVFTDDNLCSETLMSEVDDPAVSCSIAASRRKLQALQAACIVCLYQNWEGTDTSKRRIRRYRFGTVVSVARDIGLSTAKHANYYNIPEHEFHWQEYVAREEMIRTFIWVVLIDTAFVIFNNLPHRMVIKEMTMQMASPESCFQAPTAESCLVKIRQWMPDCTALSHITLREAIESLCIKTVSIETQRRMARLGPLNLFAIVSTFHYMIFQHQNLTVVEGQLTPIRTALANWKNIWVAYCAHCPPTSLHVDSSTADATTMWKRIGFSRYCAEYWLLATLLVARITTASPSQHQLGGLDAGEGSSGLSPEPRIVEPVLEKYDQTSMRQVNDLITNFGKFQL